MNLKGFSLFKEKPKKAPKDYQTRYWRQTRKEHLRMNPLCVVCEREGKTVIATDVDHIIQVIEGGTDEINNLQSLCSYHHRLKTSSEGQRAMYDNNPKWIKE